MEYVRPGRWWTRTRSRDNFVLPGRQYVVRCCRFFFYFPSPIRSDVAGCISIPQGVTGHRACWIWKRRGHAILHVTYIFQICEIKAVENGTGAVFYAPRMRQRRPHVKPPRSANNGDGRIFTFPGMFYVA